MYFETHLLTFQCPLQVNSCSYKCINNSLSWLRSFLPDGEDFDSEEDKDGGVASNEEDEPAHTKFWISIKQQLEEINGLHSEVQLFKCTCRHSDCPFFRCNAHDDDYTASSPPLNQYRKDVNYGGFESMIQSNDVVYGSHSDTALPVQNEFENNSNSFRRGTPVVRRKRLTAPILIGLTPSVQEKLLQRSRLSVGQ